MQNAGWIDYSDPPVELKFPMSTWINQLPTSSERDPDYWIELSGRSVDNAPIRIRIADGGRENAGESLERTVEVTESRDGATTLSRYAIDPIPFAAGAPPQAFLKWREPPSDADRAAAERFWTGVRAGDDLHYRAAAERYLRLPLRTDAFHCMQANIQALRQDDRGETTHERCDVWVCDDLPFGVAQVETQVSDTRRQLLTRQRLTVTAAGKTLTK
jgi:hypothetical protein